MIKCPNRRVREPASIVRRPMANLLPCPRMAVNRRQPGWISVPSNGALAVEYCITGFREAGYQAPPLVYPLSGAVWAASNSR